MTKFSDMKISRESENPNKCYLSPTTQILDLFLRENFTLSLAEWYSSCVCYGCEMSRGGPLSPCPICHSLSALHLPQNLEEEKRGLITLEPGLTAAVQLEFSWNFYLRNSSRCNHQALALGIGLKKWLLSEIVLVMMSIKYQLNTMYLFFFWQYLCTLGDSGDF